MSSSTSPETNLALFKIVSLAGPTAALLLSGFSFAASHLAAQGAMPLPPSSSMHLGAYLFKKGAFVAVPLAATGAICMGTAAYLLPSTSSAGGQGGAVISGSTADLVARKRNGFIFATTAMLAFIPWTAIIMGKTNSRMVQISEQSAAYQAAVPLAEAQQLLKSWYWMNLVRCSFGFAAGVLGLASFAMS